MALLAGESRTVRVQVVLVILAATCVEYTASVGLGLYSYRLGNVPSFVPPGHGLIYLCAIVMGRSHAFAEWRRRLVPATLTVAGAWAIGGLLSSRHDVLGAVLFLFLVLLPVRARAARLLRAFLITSYLEIAGPTSGAGRGRPTTRPA